MMEISTLGTKICDDAIHYSNGKIVNKNRFVEISPFTLADEYSFTESDNIIPDIDVQETNSYLKDIFLKELHGDIVKDLVSSSAEYIVIDLLICRLFFNEFTFENGRTFRITLSSTCRANLDTLRKYLCDKTGLAIRSERIINPAKLSEEELTKELLNFINLLRLRFAGKKIILLNTRAVYHYLNTKLEVLLINNINNCADMNIFFKKCTDIFTKNYCCTQIDMPQNLICDTRIKSELCFHYSYYYYDYINSCLKSINGNTYDNSQKDTLLNQYELRQLADIEDGSMKTLASLTFLRYKGRKLILIGDNLAYEYWLKKMYGIIVAKRIHYTAESTFESVYEQLNETAYQYKDYICVVPHIYTGTDVLKAVWTCGFAMQSDCITAIHQPYTLKNFVGEYTDCYNNHILAESPVTLEVKGSGSHVSIGHGVHAFNEQLRFIILNDVTLAIGKRTFTSKNKVITSTIYDGGKVIIGDNVNLGNNVHIRCSFFDNTYIGDNTVVGDDTVIFNGDGHAIISVDTGENINYDLNNSPEEKHIITIGSNATIGKDCFVLSGSFISDKSIVRDKSLVNKMFDCAALIAGHPAHLIKKL